MISAAAIEPVRSDSSRLRPCAWPTGSRRRTGRRRRSCRRLRSRAGDRHRHPAAAVDGESALGTAGDDEQRHFLLDRGDRALPVRKRGELANLVVVGEQQVDRAGLEHRHHLGAVGRDAGDVGEGEGDLAAGLVGDPHRLVHRASGPGERHR
jgi:hypothetical protein